MTLTCSQHHIHTRSAALHVAKIICARIALPAACRQAAGARTVLACPGDGLWLVLLNCSPLCLKKLCFLLTAAHGKFCLSPFVCVEVRCPWHTGVLGRRLFHFTDHHGDASSSLYIDIYIYLEINTAEH